MSTVETVPDKSWVTSLNHNSTYTDVIQSDENLVFVILILSLIVFMGSFLKCKT